VTVLHHAIVGDEGAARTMVFLHGILGSGANWRTFAKRLVTDKPAWRAVLVDLRKHGASQDFAPPHTVAACAEDLVALEGALGRIDAVVGHSFGGKVALEYIRRRMDTEVAWVLDAAPGARPDREREARAPREPRTSEQVVAMLETLPERFETREAFVEYVEKQGADRTVAMWLAMNVRPAGDGNGYTMRVDVAAMRALLDDYFQRDAWSVLEDQARTAKVHLVVAGKSSALDNAERAVANRVAQASPDRTWVHVLANAGHWVHVDAPDELYALISHYAS
jgi:esterase